MANKRKGKSPGVSGEFNFKTGKIDPIKKKGVRK